MRGALLWPGSPAAISHMTVPLSPTAPSYPVSLPRTGAARGGWGGCEFRDVSPAGVFFFFVCVAVFSNFDKSFSVTKVPVAAGGWEGGAELLSCMFRSLPHGRGKALAEASVPRGCPPCP